VAENYHDPEGLNLMDEFSNNISACVEPFDGDIKLVSVENAALNLSTPPKQCHRTLRTKQQAG
jgi:hypothetical protein